MYTAAQATKALPRFRFSYASKEPISPAHRVGRTWPDTKPPNIDRQKIQRKQGRCPPRWPSQDFLPQGKVPRTDGQPCLPCADSSLSSPETPNPQPSSTLPPSSSKPPLFGVVSPSTISQVFSPSFPFLPHTIISFLFISINTRHQPSDPGCSFRPIFPTAPSSLLSFLRRQDLDTIIPDSAPATLIKPPPGIFRA